MFTCSEGLETVFFRASIPVSIRKQPPQLRSPTRLTARKATPTKLAPGSLLAPTDNRSYTVHFPNRFSIYDQCDCIACRLMNEFLPIYPQSLYPTQRATFGWKVTRSTGHSVNENLIVSSSFLDATIFFFLECRPSLKGQS